MLLLTRFDVTLKLPLPLWGCNLEGEAMSFAAQCEWRAWHQKRCVNDFFFAVPRRLVNAFNDSVSTSRMRGAQLCEYTDCFVAGCPGETGHGCFNNMQPRYGAQRVDEEDGSPILHFDDTEFCWAPPTDRAGSNVRSANPFYAVGSPSRSVGGLNVSFATSGCGSTR